MMISVKASLMLLCVITVGTSRADSEPVKNKPSIDLDDYIDNGSTKVKNEDLGTSETGYYGYAPPIYQGHALGHHHGYSHHSPPAHHHHHVAPTAYHHHHGYSHEPYGYAHQGHAHTHYDGEYHGGVLGHVSSAHVSYGTSINHGYGHYHHPHGTYH